MVIITIKIPCFELMAIIIEILAINKAIIINKPIAILIIALHLYNNYTFFIFL